MEEGVTNGKLKVLIIKNFVKSQIKSILMIRVFAYFQLLHGHLRRNFTFIKNHESIAIEQTNFGTKIY